MVNQLVSVEFANEKPTRSLSVGKVVFHIGYKLVLLGHKQGWCYYYVILACLDKLFRVVWWSEEWSRWSEEWI